MKRNNILKNVEVVYEVVREVLSPHLDPLPKGERIKRSKRKEISELYDERMIL